MNKGSPITETEKFFLMDGENALNTLNEINAKIRKNNGGLTGGLTDDDFNSYEIAVHGMKSSFANIGEAELSYLAYKLEMASTEKNLIVMTEETPAFISALKKMLEKVNTKRNSDKNTAQSTPISNEDASYLREKLLYLKTACETFNVVDAQAAISELTQKTWSAQINDALDEIGTHLLHSAFDKAAVTALAAIEAAEAAGADSSIE